MPLRRDVRLCTTQSAHPQPTAPLTLLLSLPTVMPPTLESMEFTPLEPEVCLHMEASMADTEATTGGRGKPRLKETLNLERREVMDMGRQLTQDQVATKCRGVFASRTQCLTARKCPIRVAIR